MGIPAHIVMPSISTPSKIAATKGYGANVIFSGSTSTEREAVVDEVIKRTGARLVPPYDHPDIPLGQGTAGIEMQEQVRNMMAESREQGKPQGRGLDAIIAPCGGGGLLSGTALSCDDQGILVFGAEPSFEGADDCRRGLSSSPPSRIETVKTLTIADGLRTPVGAIPWTVISNKDMVRGVYAVTEEMILDAMKLVFERMKIVVEPSAVVGLAVALYHEGFRKFVEETAGPQGWDLGVILSGGNTSMEAIGKLFQTTPDKATRQEGLIGIDGKNIAENVAG